MLLLQMAMKLLFLLSNSVCVSRFVADLSCLESVHSQPLQLLKYPCTNTCTLHATLFKFKAAPLVYQASIDGCLHVLTDAINTHSVKS